jgi:hypothetical protein
VYTEANRGLWRPGAGSRFEQRLERRAARLVATVGAGVDAAQLDADASRCLDHGRRVGRVCDGVRTVGVVEVVAEELALRGVVDGHADGAELAEGEHREQVLGAVLHHDRNVVAGPDAGSAQPGSQLVRKALDIGVGVDVVTEEQVGPLAVAPRDVRKDAADRALLERVDLELSHRRSSSRPACA